MTELNSKLLAASSACLFGLISHQIFKRFEPTVRLVRSVWKIHNVHLLTMTAREFFGHVLIANAGLTVLARYLGVRATTDLVQIVFINLAVYLLTLV